MLHNYKSPARASKSCREALPYTQDLCESTRAYLDLQAGGVDC